MPLNCSFLILQIILFFLFCLLFCSYVISNVAYISNGLSLAIRCTANIDNPGYFGSGGDGGSGGGAGGGGGYYGGGGNAILFSSIFGCPVLCLIFLFVQTGTSGCGAGGGSSYSVASDATYQTGFNSGNGYAVIIPIFETAVPSCVPTNQPTVVPTVVPTVYTTGEPTNEPTIEPTVVPLSVAVAVAGIVDPAVLNETVGAASYPDPATPTATDLTTHLSNVNVAEAAEMFEVVDVLQETPGAGNVNERAPELVIVTADTAPAPVVPAIVRTAFVLQPVLKVNVSPTV